MNPGAQHVTERAKEAAAQRLKKAAGLIRLHMKQPIFQKLMGKGKDALLVRFEYPGRLAVYDPATGEQLAVSELGKPDVLHPGFVPPVPALQDREPGRNSTRGR